MNLKNFFPPKINLSPTDQIIYTYINKYPEKIKYITIEKLAKNLHTSVASIQRFCKKIGYSGFKEFKFQLKNFLIENAENDNPDDNKYLTHYLSVIKQFQNLDKEQLSLLRQALKDANKIFSIGFFYSGLPAKMLTFAMIDQGKTAFYSDSFVTTSHLMPLFSTQDDALVFFSITGEEKEISNYLKRNIQKSSQTFFITFNPDAEIKNYFAHTIVLPGKSFVYHSAIDPQSLFCLFIENLINAE